MAPDPAKWLIASKKKHSTYQLRCRNSPLPLFKPRHAAHETPGPNNGNSTSPRVTPRGSLWDLSCTSQPRKRRGMRKNRSNSRLPWHRRTAAGLPARVSASSASSAARMSACGRACRAGPWRARHIVRHEIGTRGWRGPCASLAQLPPRHRGGPSRALRIARDWDRLVNPSEANKHQLRSRNSPLALFKPRNAAQQTPGPNQGNSSAMGV